MEAEGVSASIETCFVNVYPEWIEGKIADDIRVALRKVNPTFVCPDVGDVLAAYRWMHPEEVSVVIVGQDPYPRRSDACGIAFQSMSKIPRSAASIFDNLLKWGHTTAERRAGLVRADLRGWLLQGVLMVNAIPTVNIGEPRSHEAIWGDITERMLQKLPHNTVALLLGDVAAKLGSSLPCERVVAHTHPVIPSAEVFQGVDCFGMVNDALRDLGRDPIDWSSNVL